MLVIWSASSRMMSLKPALCALGQHPGAALPKHRETNPPCPCILVLAKFLICSRTTSMPRSSDALSCGFERASAAPPTPA